MKITMALGFALALAIPSALASAAELPPIKVTSSNQVPACATPGRIMLFLRSRNSDLDSGLEKIAVEYMRRGEELELRWDYAFFQMVLETGYLTFRRGGGRPGDVKPAQYNFAGLGATGRGQPGESFPDMPTGVLAHLQHVAVYAGDRPDNPVAERTRKIIEWGIGDKIRKQARGAVTYRDLARKWATGSDYASSINAVADRFYSSFCKQADPNPELVAEARGEVAKPRQLASTSTDKVSGAELARRAVEESKASGSTRRQGLGAGTLPRPDADHAANAQPKKPSPGYTVLNPKADGAEQADKGGNQPPVRNASAPAGLAKALAPAPPGQKCRVFTASYGGQRAVLIRAQADGGVNYTVLDVNEGVEKREADAYIAAYAKGGAVAGEFTSQTQALDKAFELCPEG
jgi:hypothetical protein